MTLIRIWASQSQSESCKKCARENCHNWSHWKWLIDLLVLTWSTTSKHNAHLVNKLYCVIPKHSCSALELQSPQSWELWIADESTHKYLAYIVLQWIQQIHPKFWHILYCVSPKPPGGKHTDPPLVNHRATYDNYKFQDRFLSKYSIQKHISKLCQLKSITHPLNQHIFRKPLFTFPNGTIIREVGEM